jgi:hypothetical protein
MARRAILQMVIDEQRQAGAPRRLSMTLWDMFTGSAPYREILLRALHPMFMLRLGRHLFSAVAFKSNHPTREELTMGKRGALGRVYKDGEVIVKQGDMGDCMFVIQQGQVEVVQARDGREVRIAVREEGDFFGEMAIFEHDVRSATVRALGEVRVLTIDKSTFLRRIHEDSSLAYRIVQRMSGRIRDLSAELTKFKVAS